jgi:hypothetical protein
LNLALRALRDVVRTGAREAALETCSRLYEISLFPEATVKKNK